VDEAAVERAREAALRLLDRARKTRRELERRLADKGFPARVVQDALDRLARVGLVDDVEFARAFVRAKLARQAVSLRVIEGRLRERGVGADDCARALAELDAEAARDEAAAAAAARSGAGGGADPGATARRAGGVGERARAERALAPLLRRWRGLDPREARARATAALLRRGFDYATARDVLAAAPPGTLPGPADAGEAD
jgi:SOS response regulatory protein OraA/RecX